MEFNNAAQSSLAGRDALRRSLHTSIQNVLDISHQVEPSARGVPGLASRPSPPIPSGLRGPNTSPFGSMAGQTIESPLLGRPNCNSLLSRSLGASALQGVVGQAGSDSAAYLLLARAREEQILNRAKAVVLQETIAAQQKKQAAQEAYIKYLQSQLLSTNTASPIKPLQLGHPAVPPHFTGALSLARVAPGEALLRHSVLSSRLGAILPRTAAAEPPMNSELAAAFPASRAVASGRAGLLSAAEKKHKVTQTLKALGTTLRSRYDPFIDCLDIEDPYSPDEDAGVRSRGGVLEHFPERLHRMLLDVEREGKGDVARFLPHGRAFAVLDERRFVEEVMPRYFNQSKWHSFARQLNLYGFVRMASGPDAGAYYHELFLKSRPSLCKYMRRVGIPRDQQDRRKCRPKNVVDIQEPDFYSMRPSALPEDYGRRRSTAVSRADGLAQDSRIEC